MKRITLFILLVLISCTSTFAQDNTVLWKISGKDLKTESFILGTIHILCEEDFNISEKVKQAAQETQQIILEVNMNEPSVAMKAQEMMMNPDPDFFKDYDNQKIAFIDSALTANQLSIKMFDMLSPTSMISVLSLKSFACDDMTKIKMMEKEIVDLANGKAILDLESIESQMTLLNNIAKPEYFYDYFKKYNEHSQLTKELVQSYKNEDLKALQKMFENRDYMSEDQFKSMLTDRNVKWVEKLPAMIQNTKSLVAVGAGHLVGDTGIIKLLKDKGYTLTPVK